MTRARALAHALAHERTRETLFRQVSTHDTNNSRNQNLSLNSLTNALFFVHTHTHTHNTHTNTQVTLHRSLESEYAKKRSDAVRLKQEWAQQVSSIRICICICMYMRLRLRTRVKRREGSGKR